MAKHDNEFLPDGNVRVLAAMQILIRARCQLFRTSIGSERDLISALFTLGFSRSEIEMNWQAVWEALPEPPPVAAPKAATS